MRHVASLLTVANLWETCKQTKKYPQTCPYRLGGISHYGASDAYSISDVDTKSNFFASVHTVKKLTSSRMSRNSRSVESRRS